MNNPFKELYPPADVPESLKPRVMQSLNMAKVILEIAELFTVNYMETLSGLFKTGGYDESKNDTKNVT